MPDASSDEPRPRFLETTEEDLSWTRGQADANVKLDADLQALAAEVRKHAPVLGTRGGLEERLWAALDRSVGLLEARLVALERYHDAPPGSLGGVTGAAEIVRNIAETLDRLIPPPSAWAEPKGAA